MRNLVVASLCFALAAGPAAADPATGVVKKPKGDPVKIAIAVTPKEVTPGGQADLTVQLTPGEGFKINKYPKIRISVPGRDGIVEPAETSLGEDAAPPADQLETNYFKTIPPIRVGLKLDAKAPRGRHDLEGKLSYFYCVTASGFCAPAKVPIRIPVSVR